MGLKVQLWNFRGYTFKSVKVTYSTTIGNNWKDVEAVAAVCRDCRCLVSPVNLPISHSEQTYLVFVSQAQYISSTMAVVNPPDDTVLRASP